MSLELETLDQLLGGDLSLAVIRNIYESDQSFVRSIYALLLDGDVQLCDQNGAPMEPWRCRELFEDESVMGQLHVLKLSLTDRGIHRIE